MKSIVVQALIFVTCVFVFLGSVQGEDKVQAPSAPVRKPNSNVTEKQREAWHKELKQACMAFRKSIRDGAETPWPLDTSTKIGPFCDCFARNFLAIALTKDIPEEEVRFFVRSYGDPSWSDDERWAETFDYDIAMDKIPDGCALDPGFVFK
jgi:hypothetical protein